MKLICSFESVDMGNEFICVPVGNNADKYQGVLKLNKEGLEIINLLSKETSESEIISLLSMKYENNPKELAEFVHGFINKLEEKNLIDITQGEN